MSDKVNETNDVGLTDEVDGVYISSIWKLMLEALRSMRRTEQSPDVLGSENRKREDPNIGDCNGRL